MGGSQYGGPGDWRTASAAGREEDHLFPTPSLRDGAVPTLRHGKAAPTVTQEVAPPVPTQESTPERKIDVPPPDRDIER